jgi:hypothetical protein
MCVVNDMHIHLLYFASDTILVVVEQVRSEVQTALEPCGLKIRLDIVSIPAAEDWGTADTLRFLSDRIKVCLFLFNTLQLFH